MIRNPKVGQVVKWVPGASRRDAFADAVHSPCGEMVIAGVYGTWSSGDNGSIWKWLTLRKEDGNLIRVFPGDVERDEFASAMAEIIHGF